VSYIIIAIIVIICFLIEYHAEEMKKLQKDETERKLAEQRFSKALTQTGVSNLVAYGDFRGGPTDPRGAEADLISLEKAKWEALNAGCLLTTVLLGSGAVTTSVSTDAAVHLEITKGTSLPVDLSLETTRGPYVPKDFQLTTPNPDTAILKYRIESGWVVANATAVWTKRDGKWATVSYQVVRA
jgi:hypothetical protein